MHRDVLDTLWRFFSSHRLTLVLLTAIAVAVSLSAVFPQMPSGMEIGSSEYNHWYAGIRAHYLQWTDALESLGLFNLYTSLWFRLPLVLLALNLTICAVEQFEAVFRPPTYSAREFNEAFREASQAGTFVTSGTVQTTLRSLRAILETRGYEVEVRGGQETSYLTARRFSLSRWGTLLGHGGLIVVIIGLLVGGSLSWREEKISLSPGQLYQIQHVPSLSLRLDDFQVQLYPDGSSRSYRAQLTVLEQEEEVQKGIVAPNAPFTYRGMSFHQRSRGPAIKIQGLDAEGEPIALQALVPGTTLEDEATLQLGAEENEGYVAAPEQSLVFRLVYHDRLATEAGDSPGLLVQVYRGGVTDLVSSETVFDSASFKIDGNSFAVEWGHYAILTIVRDPSFAPTILGATAFLAATIICLYVPPRHIWGAVLRNEDLVETRLVRLDEEDKGGAPDFDLLIQDVEESL